MHTGREDTNLMRQYSLNLSDVLKLYNDLIKKVTEPAMWMNRETFMLRKGTKIQARNFSCENHEKVVHENPHAAIDPKGLRHEVGNVSVPQSEQRNGFKTHPDCMQTGMYASGALIPTEMQLSGLERRQNSAMGSRKTVRTVRDEGENGAKARTSNL